MVLKFPTLQVSNSFRIRCMILKEFVVHYYQLGLHNISKNTVIAMDIFIKITSLTAINRRLLDFKRLAFANHMPINVCPIILDYS